MADFLHNAVNWVDHNRFVAGSAVGAASLLFIMAACEPKADSPFTHEPVTQNQLQAQVLAYQAELDGKAKVANLTYQQTLATLQSQAAAGQVNAQAALDDITQKKQAIALAVESLAQISSAAAGAGYAPMIGSAVGIAGILLGLGAAADSRRKDQVILKIKTGQAQPRDKETDAMSAMPAMSTMVTKA